MLVARRLLTFVMDRPQNTNKRLSLPSISSLDLAPTPTTPAAAKPKPLLAPKGLLPPLALNQDQEVYIDGLPLKEYKICGRTFTMQAPENEAQSVIHRKTIDNRTLQYQLTIIQQPAKARACGAGPRCTYPRFSFISYTDISSCCRPPSC